VERLAIKRYEGGLMLIGLVGQAQSGKDTIADYLVATMEFHKLSFAASLKDLCAGLFNMTSTQLNAAQGKSAIDPRYGKTPRTILQEVGTALRQVHPDIWVDILTRRLDGGIGCHLNNLVITDVRYLNEVRAVKDRFGYIIRVVREDYQALQGAEAQHPSEMEQLSVPESLIDATISAKSGELDYLRQEAAKTIEKFDQMFREGKMARGSD
jgi:dephospho-CoA kinase